MEVWNASMKQAGAISVVDLEELLDVAAAFYFLPPAYRNHAGIAGGAAAVVWLAAECLWRSGTGCNSLPDEIRAETEKTEQSDMGLGNESRRFFDCVKDAVWGYINKNDGHHP